MIVTVPALDCAVGSAVSVNVLAESAGFGAKVACTPAGSAPTSNCTWPLEPEIRAIEIWSLTP